MFTVPDDHPFNADFASGNVKSITLVPGTREVVSVDDNGETVKSTANTLTFASYINKAQWNSLRDEKLADAKVEAQIKRYNHLATTPVSTEMLSELENF